MIDWISLLFNALWIVGCGFALGLFSYSAWQASVRRLKLSRILYTPAYLVSFDLAGLFFCSGLAGTSASFWEIALWSGLGMTFLIQAILVIRHWGRASSS